MLTVSNVLRIVIVHLKWGFRQALMDVFVYCHTLNMWDNDNADGREGKGRNSRFAIITADCFDRFG